LLGEKEIWLSGSGRHCKIGQLNALEARHTARILANVIGRGLKGAVKVDPGKPLEEQDVDLIGALGKVLEDIDDKTLDTLTDTFAKRTKIQSDDGKWTSLSGCIDLVFGGGEGLADWFEWLYAAVEYSCGPFFARQGGLKTLVASSRVSPEPVPAQASASPTESTGSSTGSPRVRRIEVSR
jgi:hypothetical protein